MMMAENKNVRARIMNVQFGTQESSASTSTTNSGKLDISAHAQMFCSD